MVYRTSGVVDLLLGSDLVMMSQGSSEEEQSRANFSTQRQGHGAKAEIHKHIWYRIKVVYVKLEPVSVAQGQVLIQLVRGPPRPASSFLSRAE